MADPWRILGLRSETADEKQVRSAYAKLLKVHRPDQDPEGFQQLRTAYQEALEWLQRRAAADFDDWDEDEEEEEDEADADKGDVLQPKPAPSQTKPPQPAALPPSWGDGKVPLLPDHVDPPPAPPSPPRPEPLPSSWGEGDVPSLPDHVDPPPSPPKPEPLPSSWGEGDVPSLPDQLEPQPVAPGPRPKTRPERDWPREWSYSIESLDRALQGTPRQFDVVSMALKALALDVVECGIPPAALECILKDAFQDDLKLFGTAVPVSLVSYLLQGGRPDLPAEALDALTQSDNQTRITMMVQKLDECLAEALSPRTARVFFRAAAVAALHQPYLARSITHKLRRLLQAEGYEAEFDSLNSAVTRGLALRELAPDLRKFWSQRLEQTDAVYDWKTDAAREALAPVVLLGKTWPGHVLVQKVVPAGVWRDAWKGRWLRVGVHRVMSTVRSWNLNTAMFAVIGSVAFFCAARLFDQITPARKPEPPVQVEENRKELQRRTDMRKRIKEMKEQYEREHPPEK